MFPFTTALLVFVWILILRSKQQEDSPVPSVWSKNKEERLLTLVTCTVNQFLKAHVVKGQQKTQLQHFKGRQEDESARAQHKLLRPRKNE